MEQPGARTVALEILARQHRQLPRIGQVKHPARPAFVGRVQQRGRLARTGMALQDPHRLPRRGEPQLLLRPRRGTVFGAPQFGNRYRQVMPFERVRQCRRMIVVVADIAQEYGIARRPLKAFAAAHRRRRLRRPPGIEMTPSGPAQPRTPPAVVYALRALIVLPPAVHSQPLHEQRGPLGDRQILVGRQFLEKILMAIQRVGGPRCLERFFEQRSLLGHGRSKVHCATAPGVGRFLGGPLTGKRRLACATADRSLQIVPPHAGRSGYACRGACCSSFAVALALRSAVCRQCPVRPASPRRLP